MRERSREERSSARAARERREGGPVQRGRGQASVGQDKVDGGGSEGSGRATAGAVPGGPTLLSESVAPVARRRFSARIIPSELR